MKPESSQTLGKGVKGPHKIQGIGAGFVPSIYDSDIIDEIIPVKDEDAGNTLLDLAKKEGYLQEFPLEQQHGLQFK